MTTTTLYRPVGQKELDLIAEGGFKCFPPRLPEQPIFYPVLTREYAEQIARDWNPRAVYVSESTAVKIDLWCFLEISVDQRHQR